MFDFNQPPATGGQAAGQGVGMSVQQALAGFGDAPIDVRDPFPPAGFEGLVELVRTEGKPGREIGLQANTVVKVIEVNNPGGGETARAMVGNMKNPNLAPARVGQVLTMRISGFEREKSRAFAYSDLKQLLTVIALGKGATAEQIAAFDPARWNQLAAAYMKGTLGAEGVRFYVSTGVVKSEAGNVKLKHTVYPLTAKS